MKIIEHGVQPHSTVVTQVRCPRCGCKALLDEHDTTPPMCPDCIIYGFRVPMESIQVPSPVKREV
jgi:hypothetical protein